MRIFALLMLLFPLLAFAKKSEFQHFPQCNQLQDSNGNQIQTDFQCEYRSPLPKLGEMDDFIEDFSKHTDGQKFRLSLLSQAEQRVKFVTRANIKKLELQKRCFVEPNYPGCAAVRKQILDGISKNWHEMNLSLVLGFQQNSAVRYQFGATQPDLFQFPKTQHPFGGKVKISNEVKQEAKQVFEESLKKFGNHLDSGLRDHLQETYKSRYTETLKRAPIMALVDSANPSSEAVIEAIDKMLENNQDLLQKNFDAKDLAGFYPLISDLVLENPNYCTIAEHLISEKLADDKSKRWMQVGAAGALGVGCLASAWTGVGLSLCFASGAIMTGTNVALAHQNREQEQMRTFTATLDSQLVTDFDALSAAEQDYALELVMAPLAGFGAGSVLKTVAPSAKVFSFTKKFGTFVRTEKVVPVKPESLKQVPGTELNLVADNGQNANGRHFVSNIADLQLANRNGKRVMIKSHYREEALLDEAAMYEMVEAAGIKTPYQGITVLPNGKRAIVSEYVEGGVFKSSIGGYKFFPNSGKQIKDYALGQHTVDALLDMEKKLKAAKIDPGDFQVFIKQDGTPVLFDVDIYSKIRLDAPADYNPYRNIQELREKLVRYLSDKN